MNNDFVSISGKFLPRRMVLQGIASLFGGALAPGAFAATENNCQLTEGDIIGPFYRFGAPFQTKLGWSKRARRTPFCERHGLQFRLPEPLAQYANRNLAGK